MLVACAFTTPSKKVIDTWDLKVPGSTPESAYYHSDSNTIFISNIMGSPIEKDGQGRISAVDTEGHFIKENWADGLNAPKGLRSFKNQLWVTDIDRVKSFDLKNGEKLADIEIKGAKFLNDLAIDDKGRIYVSDMLTNKIHLVENNKVSTFAQGKNLECPNGLLVIGDKLFVASWGNITDPNTFGTATPGRLYSLDLKSKKQSFVTTKPLGNLDGLEIDSEGNFIVTDWPQGVVYRIDTFGKSEVLFANFDGAADLGIIQEKNLIIVPRMNEDMISALKLPKSKQGQIDEAKIISTEE